MHSHHHVRHTLTLLEAPENPLTLDEVKLHLRVDSDDEDDLIQGLMDAALNYLDGRDGILGRALLSQKWRMQRERFSWYPYDSQLVNRDWVFDPWAYRKLFAIHIPLPPLISIDSITYLDTNEQTQTLTPDQYKVVQGGGREAMILPVTGTTWPPTAIEPDSVTIDFTCGYDNADDLAKERKGVLQAMNLIIDLWYENREAALVANRAAQVELPFGVMALLAPHILKTF